MVKTNDSQQKFTLPEIIVEGMRNDTVFRYGASLEGLGVEDAQIERRLREANAQRCIPPMEDSEVSRIVRSVLSLRSGRPMGTGVNSGATHERVDANLSQTEQAARQIEACFAANDIVTLITKFGRNPEGKPLPNGKPVSIPACTLINRLRNADSLDEVFPDYDREAGILFYINPMKINGRKNEDVTVFRTALVEYDDISKKEQVERLLDSGLPILSITDSGNKSVHALVRVDADNVSSYTKKVGKLHKALEKNYGSACDGATKNPARLSRLAGAQRKDGVQQLLYTEVNLDANLDDRIDALNTVTRDLGTPSCNGVAEQLIRMHGACMVEGVPAIRKGDEYMFGQDAIFREVIGIYPDARSGFRKEVMSYIDLMAPKKPQADPKYIRFKNGVLDIETLELTSNNGTHLLLNEVPHDWNPEAESELVDKTFGSIAQGNEAVIANLWEMFGLSLYRGHDVSRMILLQGSGANGKSTLLDMLKCLLGIENCFSPHSRTRREVSARPCDGQTRADRRRHRERFRQREGVRRDEEVRHRGGRQRPVQGRRNVPVQPVCDAHILVQRDSALRGRHVRVRAANPPDSADSEIRARLRRVRPTPQAEAVRRGMHRVCDRQGGRCPSSRTRAHGVDAQQPVREDEGGHPAGQRPCGWVHHRDDQTRLCLPQQEQLYGLRRVRGLVRRQRLRTGQQEQAVGQNQNESGTPVEIE